MEIAFSESIAITDASSVGEARRMALSVAHRLGFDETRSGELTLLATEGSGTVLLHGGGGQVVLGGMDDRSGPVARILALDQGTGIANVPQAMVDGYSTSGTMGAGLGAMQRIATVLEIFTGKTGTIVLLELGHTAVAEKLQIAGMAIPYPGEKVCGDGWTCSSGPDRTVALLVDGLGHGWEAADAAKEAIET